jgi:hypothetical protein
MVQHGSTVPRLTDMLNSIVCPISTLVRFTAHTATNKHKLNGKKRQKIPKKSEKQKPPKKLLAE